VKKALFILLCLIPVLGYCHDTTFLKVHFLYGSKPLKKYKDTEPKWFGGVMGGHVGIEGDSDKIVNFLPNGKFHWFAKKDDRHSLYAVHSMNSFYAILGGEPENVKSAIVYIPVTTEQKQKFDSIAAAYLQQTPYDYALFGMRCGAAAYDILGQLHILTSYSVKQTSRKIFYPKKLRKRLFRLAKRNGWTVINQNGSNRRKWERD
jgi:hypothetical protein